MQLIGYRQALTLIPKDGIKMNVTVDEYDDRCRFGKPMTQVEKWEKIELSLSELPEKLQTLQAAGDDGVHVRWLGHVMQTSHSPGLVELVVL